MIQARQRSTHPDQCVSTHNLKWRHLDFVLVASKRAIAAAAATLTTTAPGMLPTQVSAATAISSEGFQLDRVSFGYGATFEHQWGTGSALEISATSLHHRGDAAAAFGSSFAAPGLSSVSFNTAGREIEEQYIPQGRFSSELADGYTVSVQGFAQFGDLDGAGAEVRLSKRF